MVTQGDTGSNAACVVQHVQRAEFSENFPMAAGRGPSGSHHNLSHPSEGGPVPACTSPEMQGKFPRSARFRLTRFRAGD